MISLIEPLVKPADTDCHDHGGHEEKRDRLVPEVEQPQPFERNAPNDLDEIGERNEISQMIYERGHGLSRENKTRQQNRRRHKEHDDLGRLLLIIGQGGGQ